jgi:lipoyl(octanoyl) transferase
VNKTVQFEDLGTIDYQSAWLYQERLFKALLIAKAEKAVNLPNYLLFCEHTPVFTLGKSGKMANLLLDETQLKALGIDFFPINRGGDITFHGQGQITGYPILDLDNFGIGLRQYIERLEEAIILLLKDYNIIAHRIADASGVWIDGNRKICAVGVRSSRMITMHGFAFNVSTDLKYFDYINPCGFTDKGVTSLEHELDERLDLPLVKQQLKEKIVQVFGMETPNPEEEITQC